MNFNNVEFERLLLRQNLAAARNRAAYVLFAVFFQIGNAWTYYMHLIHPKKSKLKHRMIGFKSYPILYFAKQQQ